MNTSRETGRRPRRWWIALPLAILAPAASYLYVGRARRAICAAVFLVLVFLGLWHGLWGLLTGRLAFTVFVAVAALGGLAFIIDAARIAAACRDYQLRPYNRLWIYAAVVVASALFTNVDLVTAGAVKPSLRSFAAAGASGLPALEVGDRFLTDTFAYRHRGPEPGDVVVLQLSGYFAVKRVVATAGDTVQMIGGVLHINGHAAPIEPVAGAAGETTGTIDRETLPNGRSYRILDSRKDGPLDDTAVFHVPADSYFVLGDNRDNSTDSRLPLGSGGIGYVPRSAIVGRALWIWWSADWSRIGRLVE